MYNFEKIPEVKDSLTSLLTEDIGLYSIQTPATPGLYGGWDIAKVNDQSAFTALFKPIQVMDGPEYKLQTRVLKDLGLTPDGIRAVNLIPQADRIIEFDKKYPMTKLCIDATRETGMLEYLKKHFGSRVEGVIFTIPLKRELIRTTQIVLQEKLVEFNINQTNFFKLRKELYEISPKTLKHPDGGSDDFVWSLSLALRASKAGSYKIGVESGEANDYEFIF